MNPTIDLSQNYNFWYNVQSVEVLNPDNTTWTMSKAIKRVVYTDMENDIGNGTYGLRTRCDWLFFTTLIPQGCIPQLNSRITDNEGVHWYVSDVENKYFGNVIKLKTESRAGVGVDNEQFPVISSTSSTLPPVTTSSSTTCAAGGEIVRQLEVDNFDTFCATPITAGWFAKNGQTGYGDEAFIEFVIYDATHMQSVSLKANALAIENGYAYIYRNGQEMTTNFAGGTRIVNFANPSTGDVWKFAVQDANSLVDGAVNITVTSYLISSTSTTSTTSTSITTSP